MAESILVSPDARLRVLARADYALDASGGTRDVTEVSLFDDVTQERLSFGDLGKERLKPLHILARDTVVFVDPEGTHWRWDTRTFSLHAVDNLDATIAAYRPPDLRQRGRWLVTAFAVFMLCFGLLAIGVAAWPSTRGPVAFIALCGMLMLGIGVAILARVSNTTIDPFAAEIRQRTGWFKVIRTTRETFANIACVMVERSVYRGAPWWSVSVIGTRCLRLHIGSNDESEMTRLAQTCARLIGCRLEHAPRAPAPSAPPMATGTLANLTTHCRLCGGGAGFRGHVRVNPRAGGRVEALTWCVRCEEEDTYWTSAIAPIIDRYAAERTAMSDPRSFDGAMKLIRDGGAKESFALLRAHDAPLPLVPVSFYRLAGDAVPVWAGMMLKSDAWCPRPTLACRLEEILVAAIEQREPRCVDYVMQGMPDIPRDALAAALVAVEKRCGKNAVHASDGFLARLIVR